MQGYNVTRQHWKKRIFSSVEGFGKGDNSIQKHETQSLPDSLSESQLRMNQDLTKDIKLKITEKGIGRKNSQSPMSFLHMTLNP